MHVIQGSGNVDFYILTSKNCDSILTNIHLSEKSTCQK